MASFDIVSKFDMQEVDNSVNIATRDIVNRYDLKGSNAKIELNKNEKYITLEADNEFQLDAVKDILDINIRDQNDSENLFIKYKIDRQDCEHIETDDGYQTLEQSGLCGD